MATENFFEKYGIKDVANVTLFRIDKKKETYEAQRTISAASVLKGAVELRTVYPLNEDGISEEEGFEAYVFEDADIITGANYDCDDNISTTISVKATIAIDAKVDADNGVRKELEEGFKVSGEVDSEITYADEDGLKTTIAEAVKGKITGVTNDPTLTAAEVTIANLVIRDDVTKSLKTEDEMEDYVLSTENTDKPMVTYKIGEPVDTMKADEDGQVDYTTYPITYTVTLFYQEVGFDKQGEDLTTGVYSNRGTEMGDASYRPNHGTHEYSYAEQAFMLFAKRQNLITKTGTRYRFDNVDELMGELMFDDNYSNVPNSTERVVVLGPAASYDPNSDGASWSEGNYEIEEINELLGKLTDTFTAKAYNVVYNLYAELVVEDEMGYYNPNFLGTKYDKKNKTIVFTSPKNATESEKIDPSASYIASVQAMGGEPDINLAIAQMWGDNKHFSINDAIDALKQQKRIIDADDSENEGIKNIYGGYKVTSLGIPKVGSLDSDTANAIYRYSNAGAEISSSITSTYALSNVLEALALLSYEDGALNKEIEVDYKTLTETGTDTASNRAIYVNVGNANTAANSYIYLLHNKNYKKLGADKEGIFTFHDKKGNKVYYQDRIFATVEWLALVIIGNKGLMFVVNRHGENEVSKVAWMVSNKGFVKDKDAKKLVANGLIHTVDITVNDETFEATCAVKSLMVRKTVKDANINIPALFLDTLKITTLEQTGEETYATGGRSNSNLIGWDYGKAITVSMQDALFTPASMAIAWGGFAGDDLKSGVKETKMIDNVQKVIAARSFIVPEGNQNGVPTDADQTAQAVFIDPNTMQPYADGTPIAEGETFLKFTRSVAYEGQSLGQTIEISADTFPGVYKVIGDTWIKNKGTGKEERFQFVIPQAKMDSERSITLEADGDPSVFDMNMTVLRPDDGIMMKLIKYDVVDNEVENDGSKMVVGTENLNLLDDAQLFKVGAGGEESEGYIGATEY